jgi:hypothetical protein
MRYDDRKKGGMEFPMKIDGTDYTLFIDYDRGKYGKLMFQGKVTYLEARVQRILLRPCMTSMKTILESDLGLVVPTAICAGISAASTFLNGTEAKRGKDKIFFLGFVKRYMNKILQDNISCGGTWADWMYTELRCGLAHSFAIEKGGVEYEIPGYVEDKRCGPEMKPSKLLDDFSGGWSRYLDDVRTDGPKKGLGQLFETRFDKIFHD